MTTNALSEIVVPLDFVAPCDTVLALSSTLARRAEVGVRLVTVSSPGMDHTADDADLRLNAARVEAPLVTTEVIESNDVVSAILEAAGDKGLVAIETRARGSLAAVILGSTANALLRATTTPVLLVGPATEAAVAPQVMEVCLDTADSAEALLPVAGSWARGFGLRLRFVHARLDSETAARGDSDDWVASIASRAAEQFGVPAAGVVVSARTVPEAIVNDAAVAGAGIVAIGMRPRPLALRLTLGSVAVAVAHATQAAVLAVPLGAGREVPGDA